MPRRGSCVSTYLVSSFLEISRLQIVASVTVRFSGGSSKIGKAVPRPRERQVLQTIYDEWGHDISVAQVFVNRVSIEPAIQELLKVSGAQVEEVHSTQGSSTVLRLGMLQSTPRQKTIVNEQGRHLPARAELGFSQLRIVVDGPDTTISKSVKLSFLEAGTSTQYGTSNGITVIWDFETQEWNLIKATASRHMIGNLLNAQLIETNSDINAEFNFRIEVEETDFDPVVFLDQTTGSDRSDADLQNLHKRKILAQVLKRRLIGQGRFILASGKLRAN
jgi:hypothetical protein